MFSTPDARLQTASPGDEVVIERPLAQGMTTVARGRIFRVRPEHIAIRITSGQPECGDRVRPAAAGELPAPSAEAPAGQHSQNPTATPGEPAAPAALPPPRLPFLKAPPAENVPPAVSFPSAFFPAEVTSHRRQPRLLLFRLIGAPPELARRFDEAFAGELGDSPSLLWPELGERFTAAVLRQEGPSEAALPDTGMRQKLAARYTADGLIIPLYEMRGDTDDALRVTIYNGRTGAAQRTVWRPIRPLASLQYETPNKPVGDLLIVARYSGFPEAPASLQAFSETAALVSVDRRLYLLENGRAHYVEWKIVTAAERRALLQTDRAVWEALVETEKVQGVPLERVSLRAGSRLRYSSPWYNQVTAIASSGPALMILADGRLEILRWQPRRRMGFTGF